MLLCELSGVGPWAIDGVKATPTALGPLCTNSRLRLCHSNEALARCPLTNNSRSNLSTGYLSQIAPKYLRHICNPSYRVADLTYGAEVVKTTVSRTDWLSERYDSEARNALEMAHVAGEDTVAKLQSRDADQQIGQGETDAFGGVLPVELAGA